MGFEVQPDRDPQRLGVPWLVLPKPFHLSSRHPNVPRLEDSQPHTYVLPILLRLHLHYPGDDGVDAYKVRSVIPKRQLGSALTFSPSSRHPNVPRLEDSQPHTYVLPILLRLHLHYPTSFMSFGVLLPRSFTRKVERSEPASRRPPQTSRTRGRRARFQTIRLGTRTCSIGITR